jgi:hypothetical protein
MKSASIAAVLVLAGSQAFADPGTFQFSGEVQAGNLIAEAFGQSVALGHVRVLELPSGLRLELSAPRQDSEGAQTRIRLLQASGEQFRVLHEATTIGPASVDRSFGYLVCGQEVTFLTPAPRVSPACRH